MALTLPRLLSGGLTLALVAAGVALPARARRARAEPPAAERSAREAARGVAAGATTSGVPADITKILAEIKAADKDLLAVSEEDGRFLRLLAASSRAQHALEIGGANGYSAIWIGMGLRAAGGKLTSIEYDAARAKSAAENIRRAGLSDVVTVVSGDAFQQIPKLAGTFDFVFLDAWKRDYKRFFDMVFPRMTPHGLFLAHNVVNKASEMKDFIDAIEHNPAAMTSIVSPGSEGMSVTLKIGG